MNEKFVPITYREFYDVPRAVVVRVDGQLVFLDCPIDFGTEEYPDVYDVYRLADELEETLDSVSWTDLCHLGKWIGTIPVDEISFDVSKRKAVDPSFFERLKGPQDPCV